MDNFAPQARRQVAVLVMVALLFASIALLAPASSPAEVVRNAGGGRTGENQPAIVCAIDPDYVGAAKPPDVGPLIVAGIATKDDTGGLNPARIGSITYDNGVNAPIIFNRGDLPGLTPAHEELDSLQVNRLELWALPVIVPHEDQGVPLRIKMTFIDMDGAPINPTDVIGGCALFNGVAQDRPVTGHGGGDVGSPGTDFAFSLLPCSIDGMAADAVAVNGNIGILGPVMPGQTIGSGELDTGGTADALRVNSSHKALDVANCEDGLTWMAWDLAEQTTWVTAALSLEPGDDCIIDLTLATRHVRPGQGLGVGLYLLHQRWETVTVPIKFWIEDEFGIEVLQVVTAPRTFEHDDEMNRRWNIHIPRDLAPGNYTLFVGADGMQQGFAWARKRFEVVGR